MITEERMQAILDAHLERVKVEVVGVKKQFIKETIEEVFSLNGIDPKDFLTNQRNFQYLNQQAVTHDSLALRFKGKIGDIVIITMVSILTSGLIYYINMHSPK